jgi:hypothetical protein
MDGVDRDAARVDVRRHDHDTVDRASTLRELHGEHVRLERVVAPKRRVAS